MLLSLFKLANLGSFFSMWLFFTNTLTLKNQYLTCHSRVLNPCPLNHEASLLTVMPPLYPGSISIYDRSKRSTIRNSARVREIESAWVCGCVCVCEREREREKREMPEEILLVLEEDNEAAAECDEWEWSLKQKTVKNHSSENYRHDTRQAAKKWTFLFPAPGDRTDGQVISAGLLLCFEFV